MSQRRKSRIDVRFNPAASHIDAVLLARLESIPVAATVLIKNLLVNYFASQPGGIGLEPQELETFVHLRPQSKKNSATKKTPTQKPEANKKPKVSAEKTEWSASNLPPCLDLSEL